MRLERCSAAVAVASAAVGVTAASLKDIKHIVLFMQENRSFNHYFGTMAGVRNFADPNAQVNDGRSVLEQRIDPPRNGTRILKPWHANYLGGDWANATQCMAGGDNGWQSMHGAYNHGLGNNWTASDGEYSLAYFTRDDLPTHFDIAEGWTVLDMAAESLLAATDPNRIFWNSGSVNIPGSPTNPDGNGGMILDNNATPGCESEGFNCFPFTWKTFQEYLEEADISWQVWQGLDNFEDNMLAYFEQYQNAPNGSALREKGNSFPGLDAFYAHAANGTLPQVSWIVGPQELAEHAPNRPVDGAWLQKKIIDAVTKGPAYNETALVISYDEQGGWADHVLPMVSPNGTEGEWLEDPYGEYGMVPLGPGWRSPRFIISPYTRGGNVFAEYTDHSSDIMFVEEWAAAHGYEGVHCEALTQWRREHMSNLVNAFDFDNPDYTLPNLTPVPEPERKPDDPDNYTGNLTLGSLTGPYVQPARCLNDYDDPRPPIPYGEANAAQNLSLLVEQGYKRVRGGLTEGRFLTLEMGGLALANLDGEMVGAAEISEAHADVRQRWVLHTVGEPGKSAAFVLQSALDGKFVGVEGGRLVEEMGDGQGFAFEYAPNGATYGIGPKGERGCFVSLVGGDEPSVRWKGGKSKTGFTIFSVSYR